MSTGVAQGGGRTGTECAISAGKSGAEGRAPSAADAHGVVPRVKNLRRHGARARLLSGRAARLRIHHISSFPLRAAAHRHDAAYRCEPSRERRLQAVRIGDFGLGVLALAEAVDPADRKTGAMVPDQSPFSPHIPRGNACGSALLCTARTTRMGGRLVRPGALPRQRRSYRQMGNPRHGPQRRWLFPCRAPPRRRLTGRG